MRGGVDGKDLPSNFLLQSTPDFESASKAKLIITQDHTSTIEIMFKLCVLEEDWDEVVPRALTDVGLRSG